MRWWVLLLVVLPFVVRAQTAPPPTATYTVTARVTQVIDDEVEGISYLRARVTVLEVTERAAPPGSPLLGPGTTLSAIVRDAKHRAILRSANPSLGLPLVLGWYDESTYEVVRVLGEPAREFSPAPPTERVQRVFADNAQMFVLLAGVAVLAVVTLRLLHHRSHGHG